MIIRKIYLYRKSRVEPISIVEDSQIPIQLEFMDYTVPSGATVKAYARKTFGRGDTYVAPCTATGATVTFTPPAGFFRQGGNLLQIEVDGTIIPFTLDVSCEGRLSNGGEGAPETVKTMVEQAKEAALSAQKSAASANSSATGAAQSEASAKSAEKNASGSAQSASSSAKSAQTAQEKTEKIAQTLSGTVDAAEDATARANSAAEAVAGLVAGFNEIIDDTTGAAFRLGIDNGVMYIVEEE